jgi:hypothetical protein
VLTWAALNTIAARRGSTLPLFVRAYLSSPTRSPLLIAMLSLFFLLSLQHRYSRSDLCGYHTCSRRAARAPVVSSPCLLESTIMRPNAPSTSLAHAGESITTTK